jgi:hypothetical protein
MKYNTTNATTMTTLVQINHPTVPLLRHVFQHDEAGKPTLLLEEVKSTPAATKKLSLYAVEISIK